MALQISICRRPYLNKNKWPWAIMPPPWSASFAGSLASVASTAHTDPSVISGHLLTTAQPACSQLKLLNHIGHCRPPSLRLTSLRQLVDKILGGRVLLTASLWG